MVKKILFVIVSIAIFLFTSCEQNVNSFEYLISGTDSVKFFNVSFDANGGSGTMESVSCQIGVEKSLPKVNFTSPTGLKFGSWNTKADGSGKSYKDCDLFIIDSSDVKLYAIWIEKDAHPIIYYNVNGALNTNPTSYLESNNILIQDIAQSGYVFEGWYFESDYSGTAVTGWTAGTYTDTVRLYAKWVKLYTVSFNANGGTGSMQSITVREDELSTTNLPENAFTYDDHLFVKWNTQADGSGTDIEKNVLLSNVITSETDVTLYAKWVKLYTVSFNANGGTGSMPSITVREDELEGETLPVNTFVWTNHLLKKWNTAHDGSGLDFEKDALLSDVFAFSSDVTLYAQWVMGFDLSTHDISEFADYLADLIDTTSKDNVVVISGVSSSSDMKTLGNQLQSYGEYISVIDLSDTNITSLERNTFSINSSSFSGTTLKNLKEVILPETLKSLGQGVFYNCTSLEKINIPSGITTIPYSCFCGCSSLKSFTIPDSVTTIDNFAFCGCVSLETVEISQQSKLKTIGTAAFSFNYSLKSIYLPSTLTSIGIGTFYKCTSLTFITLPKSLTSIVNSGSFSISGIDNTELLGSYPNAGVFIGCTSLTSVVIPSSIKTIGTYAFTDCTSLTDVYYTGTEEEWNAIAIRTGNDYLTSATKHYNYTE